MNEARGGCGVEMLLLEIQAGEEDYDPGWVRQSTDQAATMSHFCRHGMAYAVKPRAKSRYCAGSRNEDVAYTPPPVSYALCRHDLKTLEAVTSGRMAILLQHVQFQFLNAGDHGLALLLRQRHI
jgi:hypothetical protein